MANLPPTACLAFALTLVKCDWLLVAPEHLPALTLGLHPKNTDQAEPKKTSEGKPAAWVSIRSPATFTMQEDITEIKLLLERLTARLEPICKLHEGNGQPPLGTRQALAEDRIAKMEDNNKWLARSTFTALAGAVGSIVWHLLTK